MFLGQGLHCYVKEIGVDFIGGFSALVQKGYQKGDEILITYSTRFAETDKVCPLSISAQPSNRHQYDCSCGYGADMNSPA